MTTGTDEFLVERRGEVVLMTLNRPDKLNAYTPAMYDAMTAAFAEFNADDTLRVAILTGAGDRAFCAGADLGNTITNITGGGGRHWKDMTKRFFSDIYKPILCAVNGLCISGGTEMMLGTDLRIAVPTAKFGLGEVRWGITPGGGSHTRLPRQIPWAVAMEILLLGQPITAERAREIGLINKVVEPDRLLDEAFAMAELLCANAPMAIKAAKEIAVRGMALETPFSMEYLISDPVLRSEDAKEGPKAFAEKRKPVWKGR
jgi:enoyl-CoA hydratase